MPQDQSHGCSRGAWKRALDPLRPVAGCALFGLLAALTASTATAQTHGSDGESVWNKVLQSVGVNNTSAPNPDINYTERPPLVVPPSRDLPPPVADPATPAANWPTGPAKTVKHAKSKTEVIPDTAVQNPNPPYEKKPWYNPAGWFSKEEYGNFAGEPVRQNLTEPPAGYRVPSPEQPYGISPEKKPAKRTAQEIANPMAQQPAAQQPAAQQPAAQQPATQQPAAQPGPGK